MEITAANNVRLPSYSVSSSLRNRLSTGSCRIRGSFRTARISICAHVTRLQLRMAFIWWNSFSSFRSPRLTAHTERDRQIAILAGCRASTATHRNSLRGVCGTEWDAFLVCLQRMRRESFKISKMLRYSSDAGRSADDAFGRLLIELSLAGSTETTETASCGDAHEFTIRASWILYRSGQLIEWHPKRLDPGMALTRCKWNGTSRLSRNSNWRRLPGRKAKFQKVNIHWVFLNFSWNWSLISFLNRLH